MRAIVTVKLPRNPIHNPKDKKTGICPLSDWGKQPLPNPRLCSDITGSHHSYIAEGKSYEEIETEADNGSSHGREI